MSRKHVVFLITYAGAAFVVALFIRQDIGLLMFVGLAIWLAILKAS